MKNSIKLYGQYEIFPDKHTVSNPKLSQQKYIRSGLKKALSYSLTGIAILAATLSIHLWLDPAIMEDQWDGIQGFLALMAWGITGALTLTVFPYMLYSGVRCAFVACFLPKNTDPISAVKAFLNSTKSSLNQRAYNLLSDEAKSPGSVTIKYGEEAMAKRMPAINIKDLQSFEKFWIAIDLLSWKWQTGKAICEMSGENAALITVPVKAKGKGDRKIRFQIQFAAIRRKAAWYLANAFVWPYPSPEKW